MDISQSSTTAKRGFLSTTRQMLAEGALQEDAEQTSSGHLSVWRKVYSAMRCPGPPCNKGPYCWRDPIGKKYYPLNTGYLKSLIMYIQDGYTLETYNNIPENLCKELYTEEQQLLQKHQKASGTSVSGLPPINITNVLPVLSGQQSYLASSAATPAPDMPSKSTLPNCLNIPGFRDNTVEEYCTWQKLQNKRPELKLEYQKACNIIIKKGLDLELIRQNPNPKFLIDKNILEGIAEHVVDNIDYWFENIKRPRTEE
jgi:hypothetical protein